MCQEYLLLVQLRNLVFKKKYFYFLKLIFVNQKYYLCKIGDIEIFEFIWVFIRVIFNYYLAFFSETLLVINV